jgi:uncharacterized protein (DUF488 family)
VKLFTIGTTQKSAEAFFETLKRAGVKVLIDTRLRNDSQLAGFSKRNDLQYFAKAICGMEYRHELDLAPTAELLDPFKSNRVDWDAYAAAYLALLRERRVAERLLASRFDGGCLVCSEASPELCHRRLAAEYLRDRWKDVEIEHLL